MAHALRSSDELRSTTDPVQVVATVSTAVEQPARSGLAASRPAVVAGGTGGGKLEGEVGTALPEIIAAAGVAQAVITSSRVAEEGRRSGAAGDSSHDDRLWTASDVARYFGASKSWVYHQAEAGRLPCIRLVGFLRFDPKAVRAFGRAASAAPARLKVR
jgi:predicted DNA-binding transcriptional regulator AlpA